MDKGLHIPTEALLDSGDGIPVVIVQSNVCNYLSWIPLVKYFSATNRVIIPRMPLYSTPLTTSRMDDVVNHLHRFVTDYAIGKFIGIGSGEGAHIVMRYANRFSGNVSRLILTRSFDAAGLLATTVVDEKPGNEFDMVMPGNRVAGVFTKEYQESILQEQEAVLKDVFFRLRPSDIPAALILHDCSFISLPGDEIQLKVHAQSYLQGPEDLIAHVIKL